jgi:hypothetical protein
VEHKCAELYTGQTSARTVVYPGGFFFGGGGGGSTNGGWVIELLVMRTVKISKISVLPKVLQCNYDRLIECANKLRCHRAVVEEVPEKCKRTR